VTARRLLLILLAGGIVLIVLACALAAAGRLLSAMGDEAGAWVVDRIALVTAALLAVDLVALVLTHSVLLLSLWEEPEEKSS